MASTKDFMEYVCAQLSDAGVVTYKKMFGEYGVYLDGKFIAVVCDNQFFLKPNAPAESLLGDSLQKTPPYEGAKDYFLVEFLEDRALPDPKTKPPKKKKGS